MNDQYIDELLKQNPSLEEILDYYLFVPKELYESRYSAPDNDILSYNLVYDLITNERAYSYVYALFYDFVIAGDNFCVGYIDGEDIYSVEITRVKLARSIKGYLSSGRLNFEGVYKERVEEILNKTSYETFVKNNKDEEFHRIIDGDDVIVSVSDILEFIQLPTEEYRKIFENLDEPYKGINKYYFVYMTVSYFLNSDVFEDYLFPQSIYSRYSLLSSYKVIDIEALNKVKKTLDDTIDKITINEELRRDVLPKEDEDLTKLEKAIYIYIKLCKLLSYDDEFYAVNQRGYVALKHENPDSISKITPMNNRAVCYEFNSIFAKLLDEMGIKLVTKSSRNGFYKGHTSLMFRVGKFLVNADSVESILRCDLVNAKLNNPLDGIICINKNEDTRREFATTVSRVYKLVASLEKDAEKVEEEETFEDILLEYEGYVDCYLDLNAKLAIMLDKVIHTGMQAVDSISYLLQLRRIIFSKEERDKNIKISVVRDNVTASNDRIATISAIFTINPINMYEDIFNNQYYFFHPNYPLVPITIVEIQELFQSNLLEYIGDKYLAIPGLKAKEEMDDNKELAGIK